MRRILLITFAVIALYAIAFVIAFAYAAYFCDHNEIWSATFDVFWASVMVSMGVYYLMKAIRVRKGVMRVVSIPLILCALWGVLSICIETHLHRTSIVTILNMWGLTTMIMSSIYQARNQVCVCANKSEIPEPHAL
jgi:hypothetical protein